MLGPVRLWRGVAELPAGPPQRRAVLALLTLAAGQPVGRDELVDALWPTEPPRRVTNVLQTHVKHLRRVLEPGRTARKPSRVLPSVGTGYRLAVDPVAVDLYRFRRLVDEARTAHAADDQARVWELTGWALNLWQTPLADVPMLAGHPRTAAMTTESQLVISWRVDAAIRMGRAAEVLALVRAEARARPLDEPAQADLMRCYLALGRRAEAFAVFESTRRRLVAELGVDPGALLTDAHRELLEPDRSTPAVSRPAAPSVTLAGSSAVEQPIGLAGSSAVEQAIGLAGSSAVEQPIVPAQLPPDAVAFVGRTEQLRWLDDVATGGASCRSPLAVVTGTAGVGKTTLAVHWSHRAAEWFPDGQLYADLRGFDAGTGPVRVDEVMRGFLTALGVATERMPAGLTAQVGLYRSLLVGRRVLVLLDNARCADQVRPLLPSSAGCFAVVTSRVDQRGLVVTGARPLSLGLMTEVEARQLLTSRFDSPRVAAAPEAVDQLVAACARLPLALAIVAARATAQPQLPLAALASQLRAGASDLTAFADEDESFDIRAVFSWSYRALPADASALFRLLGLHPGPDISVAAAAALAGTTVEEVRRPLEQLTRAHLLVEHRPGRYACHGLLRVYAADLARAVDPESVRQDAVHRFTAHYLAWATVADQLISPYRPPGRPAPGEPGVVRAGASPVGLGAEPPSETDTAFDWFAAECEVLLAVINQAAASGFHRLTCELAWSLTTFLDHRAQWHDQATVQRIALAAAGRLGDESVRARTHRGLARAYSRLGRHADASRELRQAVLLYAALGDDVGLANTEMSLADSCERRLRYAAALKHAERALALYEGAGYRPGQANALNAVGWCRALLGDHAQAVTYSARALRLHQRLDDRRGAADSWDSIGYANYRRGRHRSAAHCFRHAVTLFRAVGDRFAEALSLARLGDTHHADGDPEASREDWRLSLAILAELGHPKADEMRARLAGSSLHGQRSA
ncbi:BTAD domain-containing putative transcriptional regulator [Micromonospora sp. NPDC049047]|uniref:AfsR/SARP family transcriptional regulator n=1 Tax=Micromonospora sp. NPDC049047 TaxID=3155645 RepID=UPI0033E2EEC0